MMSRETFFKPMTVLLMFHRQQFIPKKKSKSSISILSSNIFIFLESSLNLSRNLALVPIRTRSKFAAFSRCRTAPSTTSIESAADGRARCESLACCCSYLLHEATTLLPRTSSLILVIKRKLKINCQLRLDRSRENTSKSYRLEFFSENKISKAS